MTWVMATRIPARKAFLSKIRSQGDSDTTATSRKVVNPRLEKMLDRMMEEAIAENSPMTFEQRMAVGALVLKVEAVRNKLQDDDYGAGFMDDTPGRIEVNEEEQ